MPSVQAPKAPDKVAKLADMLSAMGSEPRLRIMQLLLSAHPDGRSEAFRDLIRDRLVGSVVVAANAVVVGTVTLIYDHHTGKAH